MVILTGDTHGIFDDIFDYCQEYETTNNDVMIILGDAGINYYLDDRDYSIKEELSQLPITLFCIHGNHEERPYNISGYQEKLWHDGIVLYEEDYPNLLFAQDGEIYDFDGKKAIVIGGAYSVDKFYRISGGQPWFESEQPDKQTKYYVEEIDQGSVDKSTEEWLDTLERNLTYEQWYCGHYHVDLNLNKVQILFNEFLEL